LRREWQARAEKAEDEVARLRQKLKGIEIALARDENIDAAMKIVID
jgi:hypothetical protein